ncbi:hypothetical protein QEZ54_19810 [Catellatospora sp. KI3]|uniref:hypothetical protein n=1 Tax=Catellatospora sp. KI3 TaxID=3041620 RepID=UPI002482B137|nr:hypothetical protein [Catellatospora sp. KI3]MDI1463231.1 hypothetical protein [Catellatospora sp. KI3]
MADFWSVVDAIGSFGGMVLGGVAGIVAYRLYKVESERDRQAELLRLEQAHERARHQASRIGYWYDTDERCLNVFNASSLPIYGIRVVLRQDSTRLAELAPPFNQRVVAMPPGKLVEWPVPHFDDMQPQREPMGECVLLFTDSGNSVWERTLDGSLKAFAGTGRTSGELTTLDRTY